MKEINRRAMSSESYGVACGPYSIYSVDAEITIEDCGNTMYLHTEWVGEVCDEILFEVTTESIYACHEKLNKSGFTNADFDEIIAERDRIREECSMEINDEDDIPERFAEQYKQLLQMMQDVIDKDGISFNLETLSYADDEEDE